MCGSGRVAACGLYEKAVLGGDVPVLVNGWLDPARRNLRAAGGGGRRARGASVKESS